MRPAAPILPLFGLVLRLVLAGVFLSAAIAKIRAPADFADDVLAYRVVALPAALWVAAFLPWLELFAGFGLLVQPLRRASGLVICALLLVFVGLHLGAWSRGLDVACGCFGPSEASANYPLLIARNLALLAAAAWTTVQACRNFSAGLQSEESRVLLD